MGLLDLFKRIDTPDKKINLSGIEPLKYRSDESKSKVFNISEMLKSAAPEKSDKEIKEILNPKK